MNRIKIRKPYAGLLDKALLDGVCEMRACPEGLYLKRFESDLKGSMIIRRKGRDVFECIRGRDVLEKVGETRSYGFFRKKRLRWADLI